jgi:uncharacterized low-complexity protein
MQNKKSLIFTSALVAGAVISVSAAELSTSQNGRYSDLGTGADVRTNILFEQQDFDVNVFEMKCAAKESDKKADKKSKDAKVKDSKAKEGKCGDGKCGDGKCGSKTDKSNDGELKSSKDTSKTTDAKKANDSKSKEAKCGEGKCGVE